MKTSSFAASFRRWRASGWAFAFPIGLIALQVIAASFFVIDSLEDWTAERSCTLDAQLLMEFLVAVALLIGVGLSSLNFVRLNRDLVRKEHLLARARGAIGEHITMRFQEWKLTKGEGEVALFALKGCDIAEIARLRGAASGTIRSQLSQVYAKAGVSSQAMLVSLFIDDLIDAPTTQTREPGA